MASPDTTTPTKRKRTPSAPKTRILVRVDQTEAGELVYVPVQMPPLSEKQRTYAPLIEAACRKAVYEDAQRTYGNQKLAVITIERSFEVPFEERPALVPPKTPSKTPPAPPKK